MPVFNEEESVQKAIDSILNQTYKNFELIVVNDGSVDSTLEVIKNNKDERIKIFNQKNKGVAKARNVGIKNAINPYIIFIDADDSLDTNVLDDLIKIINIKNNYWIFFKTRIQKNNEYQKNNFYDASRVIVRDDYLGELIVTEKINSIWGKVYNRKILIDNDLKFNEKLLISEDKLFNLTYAGFINDIFITNKGCYNYVADVEDSLTSQLSDEKHNSLNRFHKIISEMNYGKKFKVEKELSFIEFKNNYAILRSLYDQDNREDFDLQFKKMNENNYYYFPNITWKIIHWVVQTKSSLLNKFLIKLIGVKKRVL